MTLKRRISINVALIYSLIMGLSMIIIYTSFSTFRSDDFAERLENKAISTAKILLEVKEIDQELLQVLEEKSNYEMFRESIVILDSTGKEYFAANPNHHWLYRDNLYTQLVQDTILYEKVEKLEIVGEMIINKGSKYYVFIAAEDKFGNTKLNFLMYTLLITFVVSAGLIWTFTTNFIKRLIAPLDEFQKEITNISANQLDIRLEDKGHDDEISLLTKAFNQMLVRIDHGYKSQKEFTTNASHELRTPVARIIVQSENLIAIGDHSEHTLVYLQNISQDANQISELINSLLLLAKLNKTDQETFVEVERIDEIIFEAYDTVRKNAPEFILNFEITDLEGTLEVKTNKSLLQIVFVNLFKNAYNYSVDKKADILLNHSDENNLIVRFENIGLPMDSVATDKLFQPFFRGDNSTNSYGSGLGLSIIKRILDYHNATIIYEIDGENLHKFEIIFPTNN